MTAVTDEHRRHAATVMPDALYGSGDQAHEAIAQAIADAEERGRQEVRDYAARALAEEQVRLAYRRASAIAHLDPSRSAFLAVEDACRAAVSSAVVVHLSTVAEYRRP